MGILYKVGAHRGAPVIAGILYYTGLFTYLTAPYEPYEQQHHEADEYYQEDVYLIG